MCQTNEHINPTIFFIHTHLTIVIKQLHCKLQGMKIIKINTQEHGQLEKKFT